MFFAGLMNGAEQDLLPYLVSRLFGLRAYGEIFGSLFMLSLFGTAIGIVGFGRLHDATDGYQVALLAAGIAMVVAAALLASLRSTMRHDDAVPSDTLASLAQEVGGRIVLRRVQPLDGAPMTRSRSSIARRSTSRGELK